MPSLLILLPLFGLLILNLPFRFMRRAAFGFAMAIFFIQIALAVFHRPGLFVHGIEIADSFFRVSFEMDYMSFIVLLSIGLVSLASLLVARSTIEDSYSRFNFINLLIIASIGMSGIVMVKDIFSLYVFLEITAVSAFLMIALHKDIRALEGAFKYIVLSSIATLMMLASIGLLLLISAGTQFSAIKMVLARPHDSFLVTLAVGLFMCGLLIKGGLVPFHGWLPDAYSTAPAPASVLLAGIVTKVSGIYTLMRVVTLLFGFGTGTKNFLMLIGIVSIIVGALAALAQHNFKRMLAYSSISQVGYIIAGFGTASAIGVAGAVFHLFNHAIFKSLLFVNAAAVEKETGTLDMQQLGGLSARMPVTGATSVIGILSTCGVPPLAGFWSKLMVIIALWQVGRPVYSVIAAMASVLTLAYLLSMQRRVFFGKLEQHLAHIKEANPAVLIASIVLAAVTVGFGIFFPAVYTYFIAPAMYSVLH